MTSEDYIKKWLSDELSEEERVEFEQTDEFKSIQKLSSRLLDFKAPEYNIEQELGKIKDRISQRKETTHKVLKPNWTNTVFRVAAVITLVVTTYLLFFYQSSTRIQTLAGEKTELYLPDSSLVILNTSTKLTFVSKKWSENRQVSLDGEAYFKVAKGSKFEVITKTGTVAVLGTQFNIKDRKEYYEVVCYEGLVRVEASDNIVELQPKDIFRLLNGRVESGIGSFSGLSPSWINQESSFESVPFSYVIDEFESQFAVDIITENVDTDKLFTGSFGHQDMELALQAISKPLNLNFEITQEGNISLRGERN